jgi:toxin CcdB
MARYDVYETGRDDDTPFLLDVQANVLRDFRSRVVVPLVRRAAFTPSTRLHPVFTVRSAQVIMATHLIAAVPAFELKSPIASLESAHFQIVAALDMLFQGV